MSDLTFDDAIAYVRGCMNSAFAANGAGDQALAIQHLVNALSQVLVLLVQQQQGLDAVRDVFEIGEDADGDSD